MAIDQTKLTNWEADILTTGEVVNGAVDLNGNGTTQNRAGVFLKTLARLESEYLDLAVGELGLKSFDRSLAAGSASSTGNTRVSSSSSEKSGLLVTWQVYIQTVGDGTATLYVMDPTGTPGQFTNIRGYPVTGLVAGLNTIPVPDSFDGTLLSGSVVGISNSTGQAQVAYTSGGADWSVGNTNLSGTVQFTSSANTFMINGVYAETGTSEWLLRTAYSGANQANDKLGAEFPSADFGRSLTTGSSSFAGNTRVASSTPGEEGHLSTWQVYIQTVGDGTATLYVMDPTGTPGQFTNIRGYPVTGLVAGLNTIPVPDSFDGTLLSGSVVGISNSTGQAQVAYTSGGADWSVGNTNLSGTVQFTSSANTFMINGVYSADGSTYSRIREAAIEAAAANEAIASVQAATPQPRDRVVINEVFTALPSGWTASGAWTYDVDGAHSPASGSYSTYLQLSGTTSLDRAQITARITVDDTASIFSVMTRNGASGLLAEVDLSAGSLKLYDEYNSASAPPSVPTSTAIPFTIAAGRDYLITLVKDIDEQTSGNFNIYWSFTFTDTLTGDTVTAKAYVGDVGAGWGNIAFQFSSGDVALRRLTYASRMPRSPHIAVLGHSFIEGNSIPSERDNRWAQLAVDAVGGDGMISGWGGANSANLVARMDVDFDLFWPRYVFVDITANDTVYATWLNNIQTIIAKIEAKGSVPILLTAAPRADRQTFLNSANAWIRSSGYAFVDQAAALTSGHDSLTWNPTYELGDGVHPNVAGHAAIFEQALLDTPWVFDGN